MVESEPHRDRRGHLPVAAGEIEGAPVSRDRGVKVSGELVETRERRERLRFEYRVGDFGGGVLDLVRQLPRLLVASQLELVEPELPPGPRGDATQPHGLRQVERGAQRLLRIDETASLRVLL